MKETSSALFTKQRHELDEMRKKMDMIETRVEGAENDLEEEMATLGTQVETALLVQLVASYAARGKKLTPQQIARQHGLGNVRIKE